MTSSNLALMTQLKLSTKILQSKYDFKASGKISFIDQCVK